MPKLASARRRWTEKYGNEKAELVSFQRRLSFVRNCSKQLQVLTLRSPVDCHVNANSPSSSMMEIKESIASSVCRKRKLETLAKEGSCKHVKTVLQTLAPDSFAPNNALKCLFKVLLKPHPSFFQKTCIPSQFMYMNKGQWEVYASDISTALSVRFAALKETAKFLLSGQMYVVTFAHMVQLNLQTGYVRSIAWIDDAGKCFTPATCFEGGCGQFLSLLQQTSPQLFRKTGLESRQLLTADFSLLGNRLSTLAIDDQEFLTIKDKFTSALGPLAKHTSIVGIQRCTFEGTSAQVKLETFQRQEQAVVAACGNANVHYAWHGTSKKGVLGIILYGFGQPGMPKHGANYGSGVYLAPEDKSFLSAFYSDIDEDGVQHMLLCKVILGKMEEVCAGSKQFCPSSEDHDTGVDDVASPSRYIVWSTHMNTHILPLFVVSFKMAPSLPDLMMFRNGREDECRLGCLCSQLSSSVLERGDVQGGKKAYDVDEASNNQSMNNELGIGLQKSPQSPWISFSDLFLQMAENLSPISLMALQQLHAEFQVGRLPRKSLVRLIRAIAGDTILWKCIMGKTMEAHHEISGCGD
ncbi:hypothetical protein GOP47_0029786 [Adiantum capillus-veneris]|nr:hypothetical protein GOP47_0029786 [Adiantum capillus-veneris]